MSPINPIFFCSLTEGGYEHADSLSYEQLDFYFDDSEHWVVDFDRAATCASEVNERRGKRKLTDWCSRWQKRLKRLKATHRTPVFPDGWVSHSLNCVWAREDPLTSVDRLFCSELAYHSEEEQEEDGFASLDYIDF